MATNQFVKKYVSDYRNDEQKQSEPILQISMSDNRGEYGHAEATLVYWSYQHSEYRRYDDTLETLAVTCQWNRTGNSPFEPYALRVECNLGNYSSTEEMAAAVQLRRAIENKMKKLEQLWGSAYTLERFLILFANAVGVTQFVVVQNREVGWDEYMGIRNIGALINDIPWAFKHLLEPAEFQVK
jgi:hypothetical protein